MINDGCFCGDCFDLIKQVQDGSVDLIVTDPPYDVDYGNKNKELNNNGDRDSLVSRDEVFIDKFDRYSELSKELFRVLKPDAHLYIFCADKQIVKWIPALEEAGFKFRNYLLWVKNKQGLDMTRGLRYAYKSEVILFFCKGVKKLNTLGLNNLFKVNVLSDLKHPTQKPVKLVKALIKNSSVEGDLVLDCFMGSGSTGVACSEINRRFIGFELAESYFNIALDRIKNCKKQINLLDVIG